MEKTSQSRKNAMKPAAIAAFFLSALCPLGAQDNGSASKVPPPQPPFIKRVNLPAAWTIAFTRPAADEMVDLVALKKFLKESMGDNAEMLKSLDEIKEPIAKPMIRTLDCTRTTDFTKEASKFSDDTTQTTYIFSIARITKHVAYDGLIRNRRDQSVVTYSPDFTKADFAGFDWLSTENYKGVQSVMGRECYFFSDEVESEDSNPAARRASARRGNPCLRHGQTGCRRSRAAAGSDHGNPRLEGRANLRHHRSPSAITL